MPTIKFKAITAGSTSLWCLSEDGDLFRYNSNLGFLHIPGPQANDPEPQGRSKEVKPDKPHVDRIQFADAPEPPKAAEEESLPILKCSWTRSPNKHDYSHGLRTIFSPTFGEYLNLCKHHFDQIMHNRELCNSPSHLVLHWDQCPTPK